MAEPETIIPAEVHSDDRAVEVKFDAEDWFTQASDEQLISLSSINFGGGEAADYVAEFFEERNSQIKFLFEYLAIKSEKEDIGFECYIDPMYALAWIEQHKSHLVKEINHMIMIYNA